MTGLHEFCANASALHQSLARVTFALCGDRDLAQDCAQEALLRAWQRLDAGEPIDSIEAWTVAVALNWCRSQLRRTTSDRRKVERLRWATEGRRRRTPDHSPPASESIDDEVRLAVLALPPRQREVIVLRYLLDMDIATIAATVGRSEGAVKNALHHARSALALSLAAFGSTEEAS